MVSPLDSFLHPSHHFSCGDLSSPQLNARTLSRRTCSLSVGLRSGGPKINVDRHFGEVNVCVKTLRKRGPTHLPTAMSISLRTSATAVTTRTPSNVPEHEHHLSKPSCVFSGPENPQTNEQQLRSTKRFVKQRTHHGYNIAQEARREAGNHSMNARRVLPIAHATVEEMWT